MQTPQCQLKNLWLSGNTALESRELIDLVSKYQQRGMTLHISQCSAYRLAYHEDRTTLLKMTESDL